MRRGSCLPAIVAAVSLAISLFVATLPSASLFVAGPAAAQSVSAPAAQTPGDTKPQDIKIAYLGIRHPAPPIYDYEDAPADVGIAGAKIAMRDMTTTGRLTGQNFTLDEVLLSKGQSAVEAAQALVAKGEGLIVADLPAKDLLAVSEALKDKSATLFNIAAEDDSLRNALTAAPTSIISPRRARC